MVWHFQQFPLPSKPSFHIILYHYFIGAPKGEGMRNVYFFNLNCLLQVYQLHYPLHDISLSSHQETPVLILKRQTSRQGRIFSVTWHTKKFQTCHKKQKITYNRFHWLKKQALLESRDSRCLNFISKIGNNVLRHIMWG